MLLLEGPRAEAFDSAGTFQPRSKEAFYMHRNILGSLLSRIVFSGYVTYVLVVGSVYVCGRRCRFVRLYAIDATSHVFIGIVALLMLSYIAQFG